jgi:hypothetical protein
MAMVELAGAPVPVRASEGTQAQAEQIAAMVARARDWTTSILGMTPTFRLEVAAPEDWPDVAPPELTYGLPHTSDDGARLVVGAEPAGFFGVTVRDYLPHADQATQQRLRTAYGQDLDLGPFVDAIIVHELGHLYHQQVPFEFPRLWLTELFANLVMVGYVHDLEPDMMPGVQAYAQAAVQAASALHPEHPLEAMTAPPDVSPETYVWYEMVLIAGACELWQQAGPDGLRAMHTGFRDAELDLPAIRARLHDIAPSAARIVDDWPDLGSRAVRERP